MPALTDVAPVYVLLPDSVSVPAPTLVRPPGPLIVPDKAVHKVLWPILGRPGVLFVDGEVVGRWRPKSTKARLEITVDPFAPLPPAVRREAEREAERVAAVREAPDVRVRWTDA